MQPLSSYLNLGRILQTPHSVDQISSLWTAYHASRSKGTGKGFICATIPIDIYNKMSSCGSKYPTFAVPLPRNAVQNDPGESKKAYDFHFLQWAFHMAPRIPSPTSLFEPLPPPDTSENPPISTILFTPLQEYKLRTTFATPYLVITNYTDLVNTHGIVLLRGEITPSAGSQNTDTSGLDFLLSQQDAQLLVMQLQNFYLWTGEGNGNKEREHLLKTFHESPQEFKWENLLKHADPL
jgi:ATP synthase mitochondrial F1 complex assembly factor 1